RSTYSFLLWFVSENRRRDIWRYLNPLLKIKLSFIPPGPCQSFPIKSMIVDNTHGTSGNRTLKFYTIHIAWAPLLVMLLPLAG
ncbi:MAG: hypothetical protein QOA62_10060, partial [Nitrososphaeraceae archaeon]|nr:hypothetical protein [Nitrososphaeraceae archaeon]